MAKETKSIEESKSTTKIQNVTIHPLVLLSVADHYHRVARNSQRRVVGVLLGTVHRGKIDATNSFAVPFEEDRKNSAVFYLDHNYLENMMSMYRKINSKERIVGFYSTGPQIRPNDLRIYNLIQKMITTTHRAVTTPPAFCIIDVRPDRTSIPTTSYEVVEEVDSNNQNVKTFAHVPSIIDAMEAEEVGVEHLLRDINDPTISTVASLIKAKISGLDTLTEKLVDMKDYLEDLIGSGKKPNQEIIANMQNILNLLPNLNIDDLIQAMFIKTNDYHMVIYLSSLIRSVIALHDLVNNKIKYMDEDDVVAGVKKSVSIEEEKKEETPKAEGKTEKTK